MFSLAPISPWTFSLLHSSARLYITDVQKILVGMPRFPEIEVQGIYLLLLSGVSGVNDPLKAHPVIQEMIPIDRTLLTKLGRKERVRMRETVHAHGITLESATYWKYETISI